MASQSSQTPSTENTSTWWKAIKENAKAIAIALVISLLIRWLVAEPRYIPSESMLPTLLEGDRLVVEKVSYHFHTPTRGDIVVFQPPPQLQVLGYEKEQAFIKRVIGEPGDIVAVSQGLVYINERPLQEDYLVEAPQYELTSMQVPENYLFVMGDNRNNSNDSHIWGFLPQENVIGRAIFRFWPLARISQV